MFPEVEHSTLHCIFIDSHADILIFLRNCYHDRVGKNSLKYIITSHVVRELTSLTP